MSRNPDQTLKFAAPRLPPAMELLAHVASAQPRVLDPIRGDGRTRLALRRLFMLAVV
jgi:trans-aconitate methyltransferase